MGSSPSLSVSQANGIELSLDGATLHLDPRRNAPHSVVSHAHLDHAGGEGLATRPTSDLLAARIGRGATPTALGEAARLGPFEVTLHGAGHILGAAMAEISHEGQSGPLLYTGDFNPEESLTAGTAVPRRCETLVVEATYGEPRFARPPRALVSETIVSWVERERATRPVAIAGHALGRAQELVAILNRAGLVPFVSPTIAPLCEVYRRHGVALRYEIAFGYPRPGDVFVVEGKALARGSAFSRSFLAAKGAGAYASGFCGAFRYFDRLAIEAQFTLSDHADFPQLLSFVEACGPERVYTCYGSAATLAREIESRLGIRATALGKSRKKDGRGPQPRLEAWRLSEA